MLYRLSLGLLVFCLWSSVSFGQDSIEDQATFVTELRDAVTKNDTKAISDLLEKYPKVSLAIRNQARMQLGSLLLREKKNEEALTLFETAVTDAFQAVEGGESEQLMVNALTTASVMARSIAAEKLDGWIDRGINLVKSRIDPSKFDARQKSYADLLRIKLQSATRENAEALKSTLFEHIAKCEALFEADSKNPVAVSQMMSLWNLEMQFADPSQAKKVFEKASKLAEGITKENPTVASVSSYTGFVAAYASRNARSNPELAEQAIAQAKGVVAAIQSEDKGVKQSIDNFLKSIKSLELTISSTKALTAMIGQPAPEIDPLKWVNGEALTSVKQLEGKVVLLDFWAVWCGPCIATFPHLKHLDEVYGPKGLTILGVTRQYNYAWDEEAGQASRKTTPVAVEDELQMLDKFIGKYGLKHRTMLTPPSSDMQERYHVTGIPHAVVVDKKGVVRLVKVGSGEQNANEIEEMIKKLLEE